MSGESITPVFVVGPPRSGTTMLGRYLSSGRALADLGEYAAFHLVHATLPQKTAATFSAYRERYLEDVRRHAYDFARRAAAEAGAQGFCDHTPGNLLVARELAASLPDAIFVLVIRDYRGHAQALARSFAVGRAWAGATWTERARMWADAYAHALDLPPDRTEPVSYDKLCSSPGAVLSDLRARLERRGLRTEDLDHRVLTVSHAPGRSPRPTVGRRVGDRILLQTIPSADPDDWSAARERRVRPIVTPVRSKLAARYPAVGLDGAPTPAAG